MPDLAFIKPCHCVPPLGVAGKLLHGFRVTRTVTGRISFPPGPGDNSARPDIYQTISPVIYKSHCSIGDRKLQTESRGQKLQIESRGQKPGGSSGSGCNGKLRTASWGGVSQEAEGESTPTATECGRFPNGPSSGCISSDKAVVNLLPDQPTTEGDATEGGRKTA
ncbi:hypothetical protein NDU88_002198 [Pleurodeles waltl]|uniref:Uncharacterized protein n=1 Tax=Pleurodeles waltl TaxID=8319 RepID=A0AAV7U951_PLEWA|nr:hypothetical protein NDU88_002198 [Pleurodeles waltl]